MVVLPLPVGPVEMMTPWGFLIMTLIFFRSSGRTPSSSSCLIEALLSRMRRTIFSPLMVGRDETRISTILVPALTVILPSWGLRRSEMSIFARILIRETVAGWRSVGILILLWRRPSILNLITEYLVFGSIWMSLAR